jgi:signal transduction histidine kinase
VVKHADATAAQARLEHADGKLIVTITDDGAGGAVVGAGSGLRGLADRVAALDGRLELRSPAGHGTCLRAELPAG